MGIVMNSNYSRYIVIISLLLALTGCQQEGKGPPDKVPPVQVILQTVEKTSVTRAVRASGNIEGRTTVKLGFMVGGKINFIAGNEGAAIKSGQLLASLDSENYKIAKAMADANLDQAQDEFNRLSIMHDRKSLSDADFTKASNLLKQARAQQSLQAKNLSDTRLYSPISGVILKKGAEVGEIISPGLPLFTVADISTVQVNCAVPETDLQDIKMGSEAEVSVSSLDRVFKGKIFEIGSMAEPATRTYSVKIQMKNPGLLIRPGMTAEIIIPAGRSEEIILLPAEAILRDQDNTAFVFVADDAGKQAFKRKISVGRIEANRIEVASGINSGEQVVIGGQHKLTNGAEISTR